MGALWGLLCHHPRDLSTVDMMAISMAGCLPRAPGPGRPLGTPVWPAGQRGAGSMPGWPNGTEGSQASKPQCPKGRGRLRPPQGPDPGVEWPRPGTSSRPGGLSARAGAAPGAGRAGSRGHGDRAAQPPGQGVRAGAQSAEAQARLQLMDKGGRSGERAAAGCTWGPPAPLPDPREGARDSWAPGWREGHGPRDREVLGTGWWSGVDPRQCQAPGGPRAAGGSSGLRAPRGPPAAGRSGPRCGPWPCRTAAARRGLRGP